MTTRLKIEQLIQTLQEGLQQADAGEKSYDDVLYQLNLYEFVSSRQVIATVWSVEDIEHALEQRDIHLNDSSQERLALVLKDLENELNEEGVEGGWSVIYRYLEHLEEEECN